MLELQLARSRTSHKAERVGLEPELAWHQAEDSASSTALGTGELVLITVQAELAASEAECAMLDKDAVLRELELSQMVEARVRDAADVQNKFDELDTDVSARELELEVAHLRQSLMGSRDCRCHVH